MVLLNINYYKQSRATPQTQTMEDQSPEININEIIKALPFAEKVPIVALKKLQDQREAIDEEQEQKIQQIKKKYYVELKPYLDRVSQIIRGASINPEEVTGVQQILKAGEKVSDYTKGKAIDGYWNGVLSNSAVVDEITEKDQIALQNLIDIQELPNSADDSESIELVFLFKTNSFFTPQKLRRKLIIKGGQLICLEGDKIQWKQNQCLTHELKKVTNKKTGQKATVLGKKIRSFFDIFLDFNEKNPENLQVAGSIISELYNLVISNHIDYFLGVINADDESDEEQDEFDEEEEEQK